MLAGCQVLGTCHKFFSYILGGPNQLYAQGHNKRKCGPDVYGGPKLPWNFSNIFVGRSIFTGLVTGIVCFSFISVSSFLIYVLFLKVLFFLSFERKFTFLFSTYLLLLFRFYVFCFNLFNFLISF